MFSVFASTKPTAPTAEPMLLEGGATGGLSLREIGLIAITAVTAKTIVTKAINGVVFFMASVSLYPCVRRSAPGCRRQVSGIGNPTIGEAFGLPALL